MNDAQPSEHVRNIALDIILTLVTCGLFNLYVQQRQMRAVNAMLKEQKYSFLSWCLLTLITCGIYHIYHEYRMSSDIATVMSDVNPNDTILCLVISLVGLFLVTDAIQQTHINRYFGSTKL